MATKRGCLGGKVDWGIKFMGGTGSLTTEDRWVIGFIVLTLGGIILSALR
jgi:hypothetical protein